MRSLIITLLVASVAGTPAAAGPDDRSLNAGVRAAPEQIGGDNRRSERRSERAGRSQASGPAQAPGPAQAASATAQAVGRADERDIAAIRAARLQRRESSGAVRNWRSDGQARLGRGETDQTIGAGAPASEPVRTERRRRSGPKMVMAPGTSEGLRQSDRPLPRVLRDRAPLVTSAPSEGSQPPLRTERRRRDGVNWATSWRHDRRYDWRRWRDRHRSLFRLGFYSDPFGWRYRPYSIGWRLWPSYYSSNYWIHDPWQYRLPYAPPGYRWIRYYDDAILIDTWDGRVVDAIRHFFW